MDEPSATGAVVLRQALRFVAVGGTNTAVTVVLFVVLQQRLPPGVAYTVVFAIGVLFTTALTGRAVFGVRPTVRSSATYAGWYVLTYGVGLTVVHGLHAVWDPSALVTALVTVGVTAPMNFAGGRLLFHRALEPTTPRPVARDACPADRRVEEGISPA